MSESAAEERLGWSVGDGCSQKRRTRSLGGAKAMECVNCLSPRNPRGERFFQAETIRKQKFLSKISRGRTVNGEAGAALEIPKFKTIERFDL